jgi:hypothetical protein
MLATTAWCTQFGGAGLGIYPPLKTFPACRPACLTHSAHNLSRSPIPGLAPLSLLASRQALRRLADRLVIPLIAAWCLYSSTSFFSLTIFKFATAYLSAVRGLCKFFGWFWSFVGFLRYQQICLTMMRCC